MANTRNDVTIPVGVWTNLYTGSGITVGTEVTVINKGSSPVYVSVDATAPAVPTGMPKGIPIVAGTAIASANVSSGASGLWAYATQATAYVLVQE